MSVRAGSTLYFRVLDTQREFWIVDGYSLYPDQGGQQQHDPNMVWKVKRDKVSGRFFFVNMGIHGKKWRLPDIYDPRFNEETFAAQQNPQAYRNRSPPSHQQRYHQSHHQSSQDQNHQRYPSSSYSYPGDQGLASPGTPPPPTLPVHGSHHQHQYELQRNNNNESSTSQQQQQLNFRTKKGDDMMSADNNNKTTTTGGSFDMYDYGSDLLNASPLRKEEEAKAKRMEDERRAEERRREEMAMMQRQQQQQRGGGGPGGANAFDNFQANQQYYYNNPQQQQSAAGGGRYQDLASQAEKEAAKLTAQVHRQVQETKRMEDSVSRQRERNDELLSREMEMTSELERRQLSNIEEHANSLQAHVDALRVGRDSPGASSSSVQRHPAAGAATPTPTPQQHDQQYDQSHVIANNNSVPPHPSQGQSQSRSTSLYQQQQQRGAAASTVSMIAPSSSVVSTVDPLSILQEQLDLERKRNEELKRQVSERDRIILGTQLSEVERERRDMNLRLKMLEAMAAFRKRRGVYEADSGIRADNRHQMLRQDPF